MMMESKPLRVGLVGAGIGGLAAAISLKKHGGSKINVVVLEAAPELGEIGAGIQMTPNVAQLLIRWGVDKAIGKELVEFEELNMRRKDGTLVGQTKMEARRWSGGTPWWVVHRMHLHNGLVTVAERSGVELITGARITKIDTSSNDCVIVKSEVGGKWTFDLVVGSDGLNSVVRKHFLPNVKPRPPTGNAAYRAIVPMEKMRNDPLTRKLTQRSQMDLWMGSKPGKPNGYIITYPISGGRDFNMVLEHHCDYLVTDVENVSLDEVRETYKDYDPAIRRAIDMIDEAKHPMKRWPLMVTMCPTWSNEQKTLVLMGDAAHSMVNHMAQGAATSMEDGAFLGRILSYVAAGKVNLKAAISAYEEERMPLADAKQQISYLNGLIYHMEEDSSGEAARDKALSEELRGKPVMRSPNLYSDPLTWRTVYEYDAEKHADRTAHKLSLGREQRDANTLVTRKQADIFLNWFLQPEDKIVKAQL